MWNSVARSWWGGTGGDSTNWKERKTSSLDSDDGDPTLEDFVLLDPSEGDVSYTGDTKFRLLDGELLVFKEEVETLVDRQLGCLYVTNYRLVFVPLMKLAVAISVPLGSIAQIDVHYNVVRFLCKNIRLLEFCHSSDMGASSIYSSVMVSGVQCQALLMLRQVILDQLSTPFALVSAIAAEALVPPLYDGIQSEMKRLGAGVNWRLSHVNAKYGMCPSYPELLCVPSCITDETLLNVAAFRSNGRIPACVWMDRGVALLRSSQPMTGMLRNSCSEDEVLLDRVAQLSESGVLYIVDARAKLAAYANAAKGKGTEIVGNYGNCRLVFLNVENIHAVRAAHKALFDLMVGQCVSGQATSGWYAGVERTGWMDHVLSLLRGAQSIAILLKKQRSSVLVHCSDGWDRTPQLTSLAQLLIDPFYRTMDGLAVLIEKEWLSFGHQFAARRHSNSLANNYWADSDVSPIFAQWLDCLFQILSQFPNHFEYTEAMLISLLDHSYSNRFVTFLGNTEMDRIKFRGMPGVWQFLLSRENAARFRNPAYTPHQKSEKPLFMDLNSPAMLSIWKGLYCRYFVRSSVTRSGTAISAHVDTDQIHNSFAENVADEDCSRDHHASASGEVTIIEDYCPLLTDGAAEIGLARPDPPEDYSWQKLFSSSMQYVQTWIA